MTVRFHILTPPCISAWRANLSSNTCMILNFVYHCLLPDLCDTNDNITYLRAVVEIKMLRTVSVI